MQYRTIEEAEQALEDAETDVRNEHGEEGLDAAYFDVVHSVAQFCTPDVARELLRTRLGLGIFPDDPDPIEGLWP